MKHIGENKNIFKQLALVGLSALSFAAAGFAAFSWLAPTQETALAASSNSTSITLNASNVPALNYYPYTPIPSDTYTSGHFTVGSWTWNDNMVRSHSGAHVEMDAWSTSTLVNLSTNTFSGIKLITVQAEAVGHASTFSICASKSYKSGDATQYTTLLTRSLAAGVTTDLSVAVNSATGYKYFALYCIADYNSGATGDSVIIYSASFLDKLVTSLSISGADSISFANQGQSYAYSVTATFEDGSQADVTSMVSANEIATKTLGQQTLTVSYAGASASKTVDVTNVNAIRTESLSRLGSITPKKLTKTSDDWIYDSVDNYVTTNVSLASVSHYEVYGSYKNGTAYPLFSYRSINAWNLAHTVFTLEKNYHVDALSLYASLYTSGTAPRFSVSNGTITEIVTVLSGTTTYNLADFANSDISTLTIAALAAADGTYPSFYLGPITFTMTSSMTYFTPTEQAEATKTYIEQFNTCPGSVSDAAVIRSALEYNAMNVDVVDGTTAKAIFATLTLTADPNCTILNKLQTMVKWYNKNHDVKIYLYDTTTYTRTDNSGTNGYLPLFTDGAGHIVNPSSSASSLSLTLIIVAASGVLTLLAIAAIYFVSKKKKRQTRD
jgi:hypothetical protein